MIVLVRIWALARHVIVLFRIWAHQVNVTAGNELSPVEVHGTSSVVAAMICRHVIVSSSDRGAAARDRLVSDLGTHRELHL